MIFTTKSRQFPFQKVLDSGQPKRLKFIITRKRDSLLTSFLTFGAPPFFVSLNCFLDFGMKSKQMSCFLRGHAHLQSRFFYMNIGKGLFIQKKRLKS